MIKSCDALVVHVTNQIHFPVNFLKLLYFIFIYVWKKQIVLNYLNNHVCNAYAILNRQAISACDIHCNFKKKITQKWSSTFSHSKGWYKETYLKMSIFTLITQSFQLYQRTFHPVYIKCNHDTTRMISVLVSRQSLELCSSDTLSVATFLLERSGSALTGLPFFFPLTLRHLMISW